MVKAASLVSTFEDQDLAAARAKAHVDLLGFDYADPLDFDQPSDPPVRMTNRQLSRLLLIAADTAARFEREHCPVDPIAWLFSPRKLFNGCAAVAACQSRSHFIRAIVLHGLSIGLDADPDELDELLAEDGDAEMAFSPVPSAVAMMPALAGFPAA